MARATGVDSDVRRLRQGATYRIVFDGRTITGTVAAHEITAPLSADSVDSCQRKNERRNDDDEF